MFGGGFAGVWKGMHEGKEVAVKVLRAYMTDDFERLRKVGNTQQFVLTRKTDYLLCSGFVRR